MTNYLNFHALLVFSLFTGSGLGFNWRTEGQEVKCIKTERLALLNLKKGLIDDYGMLSTWSDNENTDCCTWKWVQCSTETGHVQILNLRGSDTQYLKGEINSLPIVLQHLTYLDLSYNIFDSFIPEFIGFFSKLRYLNLSYSNFQGLIPYQLGNLSQLQYLDLNSNLLDGAIPYQLGNLLRLQYLDLQWNSLDSAIPYQLGNLSQLRYLDLSRNHLVGLIPFQFGNLSRLQSLKLGDYNSDLKIYDGNHAHATEWLSNLYSLTSLHLIGLSNLNYSHYRLQMIGKLSNLRELRLAQCSLSDLDIISLFDSNLNFSTSLTVLDLSYNMLTSSILPRLFNFHSNLQELYLGNFTLSNDKIVLPFPFNISCSSLVVLDLSENKFTSSIFQWVLKFHSKLQELYLRSCDISDHHIFPPSHSSYMNFSSSLAILDLSANQLSSSDIFYWVFNFSFNLKELMLHDNLLEGPIPENFGNIMNSLESVYLFFNKLQGKIPTSIWNICTLQSLELAENKLSGELPTFFHNDSSRCKGQKLEYLSFSGNQISGKIPKAINSLSELESLDLSWNSLDGVLTESHFANLTKLRLLRLSYNSLNLNFSSNWIPPSQLYCLGLASCKLGPSFPNWLQRHFAIEILDISNNGISDSVPEWFWIISQNYLFLNMSYNNLVGIIPNLPLSVKKLAISLKSNQFEGSIPTYLLQAPWLDLSNNKFTDFGSFLCGNSMDEYFLGILDVSNNQLKGQLPGCWSHLKNSLQFLDLSNNKLSGNIPISMGTLFSLEALVLRNNSLIGELPSSLMNCTNLVLLDVGDNNLSGPIPVWIGERLQQLVLLSLRLNNFNGSLPLQLCYLSHIQLLDLSQNSLSNGIPTCLKNFTVMTQKNSSETIRRYCVINNTECSGYYSAYDIYLSLMWKGAENVFKNPEVLLKSIDLSSNHLTGEIPKEFGYLLGLISLNLSRNNLSGEITPEIGNLESLEFLDLSRNHLSGKIPTSLTQIDRLAMLDLSNNRLYGKIPTGTQLQTQDASSYEENLNLCGLPLDRKCPEDETPMPPQMSHAFDEDENSHFFEAFYMSLGLGFPVGFWGFLGPILLVRSWKHAYIRLLNKVTDSIYVMVATHVARCLAIGGYLKA